MDFVKKQLGGSLKGKKIAYIFYDNPAGREPIEVLEDLADREGFQLKTFAVPPPGVEMGAQVLDIAQRFTRRLRDRPPVRPRAVGVDQGAQAHGLSAAQGGLVRVGGRPRPTSRRRRLGGGRGLLHHAVRRRGHRLPGAQRDPRDVQEAGQAGAEGDGSTVFYNRGVLIAALHVEAIRNALKAKGGGKITGEDVKKGFEKIKGFTLGGWCRR